MAKLLPRYRPGSTKHQGLSLFWQLLPRFVVIPGASILLEAKKKIWEKKTLFFPKALFIQRFLSTARFISRTSIDFCLKGINHPEDDFGESPLHQMLLPNPPPKKKKLQ